VREPIPMMEAYLPMMKSAAMVSAGELGVFHHLAGGAATVDETAVACRASVKGTRALLDALVAYGLVTRDGDRYANGAFVAAHFTPSSRPDFTPGLVWTAEAWRITADLTGAIRRGGPVASMWDEMAKRPGLGAVFARYMEAVATLLSPLILDAVELPTGARTLLDVGGSHGLHTAAFCEKHPALDAVIFDLEGSLTTTRALLDARGLSGRVRTRVGDATRDEFGGPYDVVLLLSVLHNQTLADGEGLVKRIARALAPGGMLVVHEHFQGPVPKLFPSAFDLTLLVETGTATVPEASLDRWLADAGLTVTRRAELAGEGAGSLVVAVRG
jgi:SAM-dependent methyltransferase